jgi:protocatechuate 3,4-dioxygenase beta subunit
VAAGDVAPEPDPPYLVPAYRSTELRSPRRPPLVLPATPTERHGPLFGTERVRPEDADLTRQGAGEPIGERIVVHGRVVDAGGGAVAGRLVEVWQCNAAGRYAHDVDDHDAPLDPNFQGVGRCVTGADGSFRFVTIRPGAYPWRNHRNAWRPAHIHFSFFGRDFASRLVTQMYFPGDPLLAHDPIFGSIRDRRAAENLVASFDPEETVEEWALGYRFDVVLAGRLATPFEDGD